MKSTTKEKKIKNLGDLEEFITAQIKQENGRTHVAFRINKSYTIDDLIDNSKSTIKEKEKKWISNPKEYKTKIEDTTILLLLTIYFRVHLRNTKIGEENLPPKMQKDYLFYLFLEKIYEKFRNFENIKFESLIFVFLDKWTKDLRHLYDPNLEFIARKKREDAMKNWFPNWDFYGEEELDTSLLFFYIPIDSGKIRDLQNELTKRKRDFVNRWKYTVNDIEYWESPPIFSTT